MDGTRFDALTRTIASSTSRRRFLGGLAAGLVAGLTGLGGRDSAGACAGPGRVCRTDGGCCSGACGSKDETGRRRCVCHAGEDACGGQCVDLDIYQSDPDNCGGCGNRCPGDQCAIGVCNGGVCGLAAKPDRIGQSCNDGASCVTGETCQVDGTCGGGTVLGNGTGCGVGGKCVEGVCLMAYNNCRGACPANASTPGGVLGNMCWGISGLCNAFCGSSADCEPGWYCGNTNGCGGGLEQRCFQGCPV